MEMSCKSPSYTAVPTFRMVVHQVQVLRALYISLFLVLRVGQIAKCSKAATMGSTRRQKLRGIVDRMKRSERRLTMNKERRVTGLTFSEA